MARSAAQDRIVAAALTLFARHGVGGTSLQMIADELGVTKAAVYHQYNAKEDIVLAVAEGELARLETVVAAAEAKPSAKQAREALVLGIIDLAVDSRRVAATILSDPVIAAFFREHKDFRDVMNRLRHVLLGAAAGPEARVRTAMLIASISGTVTHPFVVDLDDDVLRTQLGRLVRRFLGTE